MNKVKIIVDQVKQATDFQINRKILKEKINADLHLAHSSGLIRITPELISFLSCLEEDEVYITDIYENPILIPRVEVLEQCKTQYLSAMKEWTEQHAQLRRIRKL
jgi:hypothetical protein